MKVFVKTLILTIVICLSYMFCKWFVAQEHPMWILIAMVLVLSFLPVANMWLKNTGWEKTECILLLITVAGIVMRIGYLLYTPCDTRQHDLWKFDTESGGHAAYILTIMQKGRLPDSIKLQFYQQPFYYLAGSAVSFVVNGILHLKDAKELADAARIVSCAASCLVLPVTDALCRVCGVKGKGRILAMAFVAFSPVFYLTGGCLNPDALCTLFLSLAVLYTIKWYQAPSWKHTILLAVIYGFGVMTKISVAVIAVFTLVVFGRHFVVGVKEGKGIPLLRKYAVFGVISLPLGLWYSVRNYVLFEQPLGYVLDLGGKRSEYYTGNHSVVQRIASFSWENILEGPYTKVEEDYNAPVYYLKSSVFGEYSYDVPALFSTLLLYAAVAAGILCITSFVWQILQGRKQKRNYILPAVILLFYGSLTFFYLKYPYGCSMDYRYMGLLSILFAAVCGNFYENCQWSFFKKRYIAEGVVGAYSAASVIMYLLVP